MLSLTMDGVFRILIKRGFNIMDIRKHNELAWDNEVKIGNKWTIPVSVRSNQPTNKSIGYRDIPVEINENLK